MQSKRARPRFSWSATQWEAWSQQWRLQTRVYRKVRRMAHHCNAQPSADRLSVASGLVGAVVTLATPHLTSPWLGQVRLPQRNTGWS